MAELDLIDDRKTAEQVVSRCIGKGYGLSRAKQALYEKRIPKQYWEEVLADYPDQTEAIVAFLRTKLGSSRDERDLRRAMDAGVQVVISSGRMIEAYVCGGNTIGLKSATTVIPDVTTVAFVTGFPFPSNQPLNV